MLLPVFILFGLSLLILGSLSLNLAFNQAMFMAVGLAVFWFTRRYPWDNHRFLIKVYFYLCVGLLILPYLFGAATRGAVRWIPLGSFSLQPSELVKPLLILIFSDYLAKRHQMGLKTIAGYLLLVFVPVLLIFKQPDLGTSLVVGTIGLGLLLMANLKTYWRWAVVIGLAVVLPFGLVLLKPYQRERLRTFVNPYADPAGSGYQVIQAQIAVGSGGLFGRGLGRGSQSQLKFLPERQTDFVFASLAEEMGLVTALTLLAAYWWLGRELIRVFRQQSDQFAALVGAGVFLMIWFQAAVSLGMNLGLMPVTGITLPLVSAGGSSIMATMISLGLAAAASREGGRKKPLEIY